MSIQGSIRENATAAAGKYEPVSVEARYENPRCDIASDPSLNWLKRLSPVLLVNKWAFGSGFALTIVAMLASVSIPALTGKLIDAIGPAVVSGQIESFKLFLWILCGLSVVRFAASFGGNYQLGRVSNQLESDLRSIIYNHLLTLCFSFYDNIQTGQVISRANSDIKSIQMFLMMAPMLLTSALSFVFAASYMFSVSITLTLASIVAVPGVYTLSMRLRRLIFPLSWLTQARQADVAVIVDENINGQRVVKSYAQEEQQLRLLARAASQLRWVQVRAIFVQSFYNPIIENLTVVGQVLVWVYGGYLVIEGEIALGTLVAFNMYIMMIQMPFRLLGFLVQMEQRAKASASRIFEILDQSPAIVDQPGAVDLPVPKGHIAFENVRFAYDEEPVLHDVSFTVAPGETVAIMGRTGSGKSTVVRLLARFYEIDGGSIKIDGIDVRELNVKSLHYHVGQVLDEPFLFSTSIKDNIAYGRPDASLNEIVGAAKAAQAHDFIELTEHGYDTVVGERGYTLSGGQRQRIGIARALLMNPPILVLDDATSAIDVTTESAIHEALVELMNHRTTVLIAHRLSTIRLADRVLLLDEGRIKATGTHEQLLASTPRYGEILALQQHEPRLENPAGPSSGASHEVKPADTGGEVK